MRTLTDVFTTGAPTITEGLRTLVVSPERELEPGMTVRATFTFRNQGGAAATGVRVRLNVPEGLVYLVGTGSLDGELLDDEHGNSPLLARAGADIGDVAPGEERRIDIAYSVAGAIENGSLVEIQAAVAAFELPPVGSNIVRLVARSRPALDNPLTTVAIESRGHEPAPGGEATVTLRIHNAGESSAHDVVAVCPVPEHTTYVAQSARINGREVERDLHAAFDRIHAPVVAATLAANATVTLQYRVRIDDPLPDGTPIATRAEIASQETPAFALTPAVITVRAHADFEDENTFFAAEPASEVAPGSRVKLRVRAHNAGSATAENLTVALVLADGLVPVRTGVCVDGRPLRERKSSALNYDLGPLPARETLEFVAEAVVVSPLPDNAQLPVQAKLRWDPPASGSERPCLREFERIVTVRSLPALTKRRNGVLRIGSAIVQPGAECEAAVTIANEGSAAITDAVLQFHVDGALDDVRVLEKNARVDTDLGTIEPYSSRKLTVRARIRSPYPDRSEIVLGASLHAQELGEVHLGEARWRVDSHPAFSPSSSALSLLQDDVFRPNQLVDVFVRLRNEGTDVAQNVRLRLFVSPEARLESVEGATRERSTLVFGEIPPGGGAEARLGVRLLRSLAKAHPVTLEAVITADAMLPVQLSPLTIVTTAEPNFSIGTLHSQPEETAEAGEEIEFILHVRNSGDGPAQRAEIRVDQHEALVYVPNTTSVNDLPVRDAGSRSPLMTQRGLAMSDVDPGIEATIRWREVVNTSAPSGQSIVREARISYESDRVDSIAAHEIKVRCAPAFANTIAGLPFGLDGMLGAAVPAAQRALTGSEFVELPPATPVARTTEIAPRPMLSLAASTNGHAAPIDEQAVPLVLAFDRDRLERTLRFLSEARFTGLVSHLFAIRAFFPDAAGGVGEAALHEMREGLRETLDRLFIKLRLPNYVIAPRDLESSSSRAALESVLRTASPQSDMPAPAGTLVLRAAAGEDELRALRNRLADAPLATALPWAVLARFVTADGEAMQHYRSLLASTLDELEAFDDIGFIDALQRRPYPIVDAALDIVRAQLGGRA